MIPPSPSAERRSAAGLILALALIVSTGAASWLVMQAVHEFGHVLHAWMSGGSVARVVLHPLEISRTDVEPNPHPQFVAWGGPVWGSVIPVLVWLCVRWRGWPREWLLRFFAGFCLIANGAYLGVGAFFPVGDAEVLLHSGVSRWSLAVFGLATFPAGLWLWNALGPYFGWGPDKRPIDRHTAAGVMILLTAIVALEILFHRT